MSADNVIVTKATTCMRVVCSFHRRDGRYEIRYYEKESLVVVRCVACSPQTEVMRFKIARPE